MSTNSTIAMQYPDGHVRAIYCHWDGYPSHNGRILLQHYSNPWLLDTLLSLGAISILRPKIGQPHPFGYEFDPGGTATPEQMARWDTWTLAYHRDRSEPLRIMEFPSGASYLKDLPTREFNYLYLLGAHEWVYRKYDSRHVFNLREILETEETQ